MTSPLPDKLDAGATGAIRKPVQPKLDQNIMLFVRLLRRIGLPVGPASMIDAVDAVRAIGVSSKLVFYHALASCLIKRPEDRQLFEQAFHLKAAVDHPWRLVEMSLEVIAARQLGNERAALEVVNDILGSGHSLS